MSDTILLTAFAAVLVASFVWGFVVDARREKNEADE